MSHIKRALDVVQDLRNLADSIEALAGVVSGDSAGAVSGEVSTVESTSKSTAQTTTTTPTTPGTDTPSSPTNTSPTDTPKPTIVELRAFVSERSTPENRPRIKAILGRYGVTRLTELSEDKYADVMREVAAL